MIESKQKPTKWSYIQELIVSFIEEYCELGEDNVEDTKVFYDEFEKVSLTKGFETLKKNGFTRQNFRTELLKVNSSIKVKQWAIDGKKHGFSGIRLKKQNLSINDIIHVFVKEKCFKSYGQRVKQTELWAAFKTFAQNDFKQTFSKKVFYDTFKELHPDLTQKYISKCDFGFVGISLC